MAVAFALLIVAVILLVIILIISAVILSNQTQSVVNNGSLSFRLPSKPGLAANETNWTFPNNQRVTAPTQNVMVGDPRCPGQYFDQSTGKCWS
jgi:hypothetical protein